MSVAATQSVSGGFGQTGNLRTTGNNQMDMQAFLSMFTTQLRYQDPSNPLESYELAAQLAQFTSVEKLTAISSQLKSQEAMLSAINSAQMVDLVGKEVIGVDNTLKLEQGQASQGSFKIDEPADVTVNIYDANGQLVRTMALGQKEPGTNQVEWDGKSDGGDQLPDGSYSFEVKAVNAAGETVEADTTITGTVFAFRMIDGLPYLILNDANGVQLPIGKVQEVHSTGGSA